MVLRGPSGSIFTTLLGFTEPYWALLGLTGSYWALMGFTECYWALLDLTGSYCALLEALFHLYVHYNLLGCFRSIAAKNDAVLAGGLMDLY